LPKRCVFRDRLKESKESPGRRSPGGRSFHTRGPAAVQYLTLLPATGGKLPPSTVFVESLIFPNTSRRWFLWHCYRPPGLSETVEII